MHESFAFCASAVLLLAPAAPQIARADSAECLEGRVTEEMHQEVMEALLQEVSDHRYQVCVDGTECYLHMLEVTAELRPVTGNGEQDCDSQKPWIEGFPGMVDPRQFQDGTLEQYRDAPERRALWAEIERRQLAAAKPSDKHPGAVITMGGPGSGKSTTLEYLELCQKDVVQVNSDLVKEALPEYQAAKAAYDRLAADRVHEESSLIADRVQLEAIKSRREVCIDSVQSDRAEVMELIALLKESGYRVTVIAVTVPFELAWERIQERGERTGRFVPHDYAVAAHESIRLHADEVLRSADVGLLYDTSGPVEAGPELLREYRQGKVLK
jgi:predicted ABC-type ATPase